MITMPLRNIHTSHYRDEVKYILSKNPDVHAKSESALQWACKNGHN